MKLYEEIESLKVDEAASEACQEMSSKWWALPEMTPIEQMLMIAFMHPDGFFCNENSSIKPQHQIGEFRVDFFIKFDGRAPVVIECDGHDFHERTKEQARKDKSRDRELMKLGHTVIRFTGSEIWEDPKKCANQIFEIIAEMPDKR